MLFPKPKRLKDKKALAKVRKVPCLACGSKKVDVHHIKSRKTGGPDIDWNILPTCRWHHNEVHSIGLAKFADKYSAVQPYLERQGWTYDYYRKKWQRHLD